MLPILIISGLGILLINELSKKKTNQFEIKPRLFISHSWKDNRSYKRIIKKLDDEGYDFYNHSIPKDKASYIRSEEELKLRFKQKMQNCDKILVLATKGIKKNSCVGWEVEIAASMGKEIIAIKPYGQIGIPKFIKNSATTLISTNRNTMINLLKK